MLAQKEDPHESFNELMDTLIDFSEFVMNRFNVDTLTPELLADLTFELMKALKDSNIHMICASPLLLITYSPSDEDKAAIMDTINGLGRLSPQTHMEYARDVYSIHRIIAITNLTIVEWHNYKHLDQITICRDDDKLYTFKEGDYKRLRLQDIEDMLLLLVQGMLKNLTIKEQKKNRLMRIDELYKFSDATLNDVRERAGAMIQAINQQLRNRRIMRSLENFVGGRPRLFILNQGESWLLEPLFDDSSVIALSLPYLLIITNLNLQVLLTIGAADP
ncbi:hypothetical protein Tco_0941273 [Tanacetum coccineum]|uniref:Uncharacterized protein n=1 Tax=Tanacetum coccineum TaxID=301880 RepID=A0ABQ5DRA1_9ASTR